MSGAKAVYGHALSDGSGRDSYAIQRPTSVWQKPAKKLLVDTKAVSLAIKRNTAVRLLNSPKANATKEGSYQPNDSAAQGPLLWPVDVFVPETTTGLAYTPTAKPFFVNCRVVSHSQKTGDVKRHKERDADKLRRDADVAERALKSTRSATLNPSNMPRPYRLQRTALPVLGAPKHQAARSKSALGFTMVHDQGGGDMGDNPYVLKPYLKVAAASAHARSNSGTQRASRPRTVQSFHDSGVPMSPSGPWLNQDELDRHSRQVSAGGHSGLNSRPPMTGVPGSRGSKAGGSKAATNREEGEWVWVRVPNSSKLPPEG